MPAAARVTDISTHGGTITGPGEPTVQIGGMPACVAGDMHVCSYRHFNPRRVDHGARGTYRPDRRHACVRGRRYACMFPAAELTPADHESVYLRQHNRTDWRQTGYTGWGYLCLRGFACNRRTNSNDRISHVIRQRI